MKNLILPVTWLILPTLSIYPQILQSSSKGKNEIVVFDILFKNVIKTMINVISYGYRSF